MKLIISLMLISFCMHGQKELKIKKGKVFDKDELIMYCESEKKEASMINYKFKTLQNEVICTMQKYRQSVTINQFYVSFPTISFSYSATYEANEEQLLSSLYNNRIIQKEIVNRDSLIKYAKGRNIPLITKQGPLLEERELANTGNKEVDSFFDNLGDKYKPVLSDGQVTYMNLTQNYDYIKGSYFFFQVGSGTFLNKSKVKDGKLNYIAWIKSEVAYNSPLLPIVFQMTENNWVKERKKPTSPSKYKYEFNHLTKQGDVTTIVAEPSDQIVMDAVDDQGTLKQMPVVRIVGISDKYGVWEEKK